MSSSGDMDPLDFVDEARGRSIVQIIGNGIAGWMLAVIASIIAGTQTIFEFLWLPFDILIDIASDSADAFILEPFGLTETGTEVTAGALESLEGFAGLIGLPLSVVVILITLFIVVMYLQFATTSNLLPGLFVDNRVVDFFFTSPEEEAEGED